MRLGKFGRAAAQLLTISVAGTAPLAGHAQAVEEPWRWTGSVNGWLPGIDGETSFRGSSGPAIEVSPKQVLDALQFTLQGSLEARKGRWGIWSDVVYANFGATKKATRDFTVGDVGLPAGVTADLDLDVASWFWTTAGVYNLSSSPDSSIDLLAGARLLDMDQTLDWRFNGTLGEGSFPPREGSSRAVTSNWDGIVGVKGRASLSADRKWFLPYYLDVGAGESKLTWMAIAGVGYQFGWGALTATWRHLDYDMKSGSAVHSLTFSGAAIGATFQW
jgi:hypothetical protein